MTDNLSNLIKETANSETSISVLLRRSKVIASELGLDYLIGWINFELQGYKGRVPGYREVEGNLQGINALTGWERVYFGDQKAQAIYSKQRLKQSVTELEDLLLDTTRNNYLVRHSPELNHILSEATGVKTEFSLSIQRSQIKGVVEAIRNALLDRLLELKKAGIESSAGATEKQLEKAKEIIQEVHIGNIENFQGSIGSSNQNSDNHQDQEVVIVSPERKEGFLNKFFWQVIVALFVTIIGAVAGVYFERIASTF